MPWCACGHPCLVLLTHSLAALSGHEPQGVLHFAVLVSAYHGGGLPAHISA